MVVNARLDMKRHDQRGGWTIARQIEPGRTWREITERRTETGTVDGEDRGREEEEEEEEDRRRRGPGGFGCLHVFVICGLGCSPWRQGKL